MEYHMSRPKEAAAERQRMPVAYLPLGILEWHGRQNPLGLDAIKAHAVLNYLSDKIGGLTMPPLYWGDHRGVICELVFDPAVSDWLPPGTVDHSTQICDEMGLSRERLAQEAKRCEDAGGWDLWKKLLVHCLFQIESLGFEMIVPYPGHYPLMGPLNEAIETYKTQGGTAEVFTLTDQFAHEGDHAAKLETSLLLRLTPELVDLGQLSATDPYHLGVLGEDPLEHASAEFGQQILDKFEEVMREKVATVRRS